MKQCIFISGLHFFSSSESSKFKRNIQNLLAKLKIPKFKLHILFIQSNEMKLLTRRWKKKQKSTNVLAFPINNLYINVEIYGIIIISISKKKSSNINQKAFSLFIHGFLHLLGLNHHKNFKYAKQQLVTETFLIKQANNVTCLSLFNNMALSL
ncbi:MAG: rRNA maturation RNase YbeY [Deltaproteobacteria bacterium]|nr:MAG: rRNA maturation RNase YbeY [Deltaproteobacteria bacterium]